MRAAAVLLALALALPGLAQAQVAQSAVNAALRGDTEIWSGLIAMGIAREIGERCPTIEARRLRGQSHALGLYNRARGLGYSRQQVMGFIDDRAEKDRLRAEVTAWFAARGLREGSDPQGFCAVGRAEIAAASLAGSFLRAR